MWKQWKQRIPVKKPVLPIMNFWDTKVAGLLFYKPMYSMFVNNTILCSAYPPKMDRYALFCNKNKEVVQHGFDTSTIKIINS